MTTLEIWLIIIFLVSAVANIFTFLFARDQSQRIVYFSQNITDLVDMLSDYNKHLKKIYSLEMFYGDETLSHLLEHTRALSTILDTDYSEITHITQPLEVIIEEEEQIEEEYEEEKDVLYAGSRRRDS